MTVDFSVELAPYFVLLMCVATPIQAIPAANGSLLLVTIVKKEIYSAHASYTCNHNTAAVYVVR